MELIDSLKSQMTSDGDTSGIVSQELLAKVVSQLSHDSQDIMSESVQLLSAFETPKLTYDTMRKEFKLSPCGNPNTSLLGNATDKVEMFLQRFNLLEQRLLRQDLFKPKLVASREASATVTLTPVESLLGRPGVRTLLGMLTQVRM